MIITTENTTHPLQFSDSSPDTHTEELLNLCEHIGFIADRTRTVLKHRQDAAPKRSGTDIDRNLLHLQARLETIMSRLQGTVPLLDSLDAPTATVS
ncbi:MAG: hypothetical protein R2834_13660 [Rhodothermales bacterium]